MARAIGVDIGARTVKTVELAGTGKSWKVTRLAIRDIPEDGELAEEAQVTEEGVAEVPSRQERISAILTDVFKSLALAKENTCASFSAGRSMIREITVPFLEDDQIRKVVKFEAENHLHSHGVDDVVVNWIKTGETKDGSRLTIFASPKDDLADSLAVMRRAAIDPASVDLDATALYTLFESLGTFEENPNVILMDVGASCTNLVLVADGRPRVFRSFVLGVGPLEHVVANELGVGLKQGRHELLTGGGPHPDDLYVAPPTPDGAGETEKSLTQLQTDIVSEQRAKFVAKLHREAIRSLMAVRTESPPDRILLTGGGSLVPGVAEALAERFGMPVEKVDLFEKVDCKDPGPDARYAGASVGPAIGCALRLLGRNPLGIELLQDEFAPRNMFDVIRTALATAVTLAFLALAGFTLSTKQQLTAEQTRFSDRYAVAKNMFRRAEIAFQQGVEGRTEEEAKIEAARYINRQRGHGPERIRRLRSQMIRRYNYLEQQLGLSKDLPKLPSAVMVMTEFYKALSGEPREELGEYFRIDKLNILTRRMTATLIVDGDEQIEKARTLLNRSAYFRDRAKNPNNVVEMGTISRQGDRKKAEITISFRVED